MAALAVLPSSANPSNLSVKPRILRAQFGDGYSQRVADGINYLDEKYNLSWDQLDDTERSSLQAQFEALAGDTVDWTPNNESASKKFTVESYNFQNYQGTAHSYSTCTAVLVREYDL